MRKLIIRIFALLIYSIIGYGIVIITILILGINNWFPGNKIRSGQGFTLAKTREIRRYSNIDVLFLGSSNVLRGIDTRLFEKSGIKAFNLGTYGQSPYNSYFLLKEHFSHLQPKYVVLDLYWPLISQDGTESTFDIVSNHELTGNMIAMAVSTHNVLTIRDLIAISLSRLLRSLESVDIHPDYQCTYIPGGYVATSYVDTERKKEQWQHLPTKVELPSKIQLEYINKIISFCEVHHAKLMITSVPVTQEFKNNTKNYNSYTSEILELSKRKNVPFIDYNLNHNLNLSSDKDYSDQNHMNIYGATKFTQVLLMDFITRYSCKPNSLASK